MKAARLSLIVVCLVLLAVQVMAQAPPEPLQVIYTGQFCDCLAPTQFCARVLDATGATVYGVPIYFRGVNFWNQGYTAAFGFGGGTTGPVPLGRTGALGEYCALESWPPNVYMVEAVVPADDIAGAVSPPVAVTILSPYWCGVFAGGEVCFNRFITPALQNVATQPREATLGFIYAINCLAKPIPEPVGTLIQKAPIPLPAGNRTQLLLIDPPSTDYFGNPTPQTIIKAQNFSVGAEFCKGNITRLIVRGYCSFSQGGGTPQMLQFQMWLTPPYGITMNSVNGGTKYPPGQFCIQVYGLPFQVIYEECGPICNGCQEFRVPRVAS